MREIERTIFEILKKSKYTVALSGFAMLKESGYPEIRDGIESYDIESRYGYSAEELLSSAFFSTRREQFYEFYRNEILGALEKPPGRCFYNMARLEQAGMFQTIITRRIFGLPGRAGCKNVIYMHGNVARNYCTHCGKEYPMEFIRDSKKIPRCEECGSAVRPDLCLFGEMVDNRVITHASTEVQKADVMVALGTHLKTYLCQQLLEYFQGSKLIVIHEDKHFSDRYADFVMYSRVDDGLERIIKVMEEEEQKHE